MAHTIHHAAPCTQTSALSQSLCARLTCRFTHDQTYSGVHAMCLRASLCRLSLSGTEASPPALHAMFDCVRCGWWVFAQQTSAQAAMLPDIAKLRARRGAGVSQPDSEDPGQGCCRWQAAHCHQCKHYPVIGKQRGGDASVSPRVPELSHALSQASGYVHANPPKGTDGFPVINGEHADLRFQKIPDWTTLCVRHARSCTT